MTYLHYDLDLHTVLKQLLYTGVVSFTVLNNNKSLTWNYCLQSINLKLNTTAFIIFIITILFNP